MPTGIRREIKVEANGECAICNTHGASCEAAHIESVAKSKSNHPHNLIWLCANHHTKYDNGAFSPDKENREFVVHFKLILHRYKKTHWENQAELSRQIFAVIDLCGKLKDQLSHITSTEQVDAVERIAKGALTIVPKLASASNAYPAYARMVSNLEKVPARAAGTNTIRRKLTLVDDIRETFSLEAGLITCPLCQGSSQYRGYDCPVCLGSGAIDRHDKDVDLRDYKEVGCPLCEGLGRYNGDDCPECGGDGRMERRFAERIDLRDYKEVDCPLCKGEGRYNSDGCPECGGDGKMERRFAERIDLQGYKQVDCPLCKAEGTYNGYDCPVCDGDRRMDRRFADQIDVSEYKQVKCPLCKGEGVYRGEVCRPCDGEGLVTRRQADQLDLEQYK